MKYQLRMNIRDEIEKGHELVQFSGNYNNSRKSSKNDIRPFHTTNQLRIDSFFRVGQIYHGPYSHVNFLNARRTGPFLGVAGRVVEIKTHGGGYPVYLRHALSGLVYVIQHKPHTK